MSEWKKYGADALFRFPLIDAGAQDFVTSITPAAGDAKLFSDAQISANIAAETVPFTSGSEEPSSGDTIDGATSAASGTFMFAVVTSGTWGGGDAAGHLFLKSVSGTFQSENLDINGGTTNVMTIGADTTAGLFVELGNGNFACALTATEMTCKGGEIQIIDSSTKAWEDQQIPFTTFGHASAAIPFDFNDTVRGGLTALPNAAADAAGGLPISDAGGLDLDTILAVLTALGPTAAARLALSAGQIIPFTVDTGTFTSTTTAFECDDITEATADHFNGRVALFTSGALAGQATSISDYSLEGSNGRFTVVATTEAPANDVTGIII